MNWEAVAAVAELAGALGVIISLAYLAKQISVTNENVAQNTTALFNQGGARIDRRNSKDESPSGRKQRRRRTDAEGIFRL